MNGSEYDVLSAFIATKINTEEGEDRIDKSIVKLIISDTSESGDDYLQSDP